MNKVGSLRFEIKLDLNNTESYEISLLDLMKDTSTSVDKTNKDESDEMNNYVKQLEKKYGPVAVVKGKKIRVNDFLIQGTGYDADDPFIDDSGTDEAVVVAPDLMTQYGGFFINNDTLKLTESSFVIDRVEGEVDSTILAKQPFQHKNNKMTKSQQLISQARKRLSTTKKLPTSNHRLDEIINDVVSIKIRKENHVKSDQEHSKPLKKQESPDALVVSRTPEKDQLNGNNQAAAAQQAQKTVALPANLPDNLKEKMKAIIDMSKQCKTDGTKLSSTFNSLLMEVDMILTAKNISKIERSQVIRYLSNSVDMKYESIARRMSKFKENRKKSIQSSMLKNLEDAIMEAMPDTLAKYESDKQIYQNKLEAAKSEAIQIDLTNSQSESEVKTTTTTTTTATKPPNKITCPKRYFKWNPKCKTLFLNLVTEELEVLKNGKNKTAPEEHLTRFFTSCVLGLWPAKWMTILQLMKTATPVINEFKLYIATGKEFKPSLPLVKQKTVHKLKNNQNGALNKSKEVLFNGVKLAEHKLKPLPIDMNCITTKETPINPVKVLISPTKSFEKGHLDTNSVNESSKSRVNEHHKQSIISQNMQQNKPRKQSPPLIQMPLNKIHQTLQTSPNFNIIDKSIPNKDVSKRPSVDVTQGSNMKAMVLNHQEKPHNVPVMHRMPNEDNLPYMFNHLYSNHNHVPCPVNSSDQQMRIGHHLSPTNNQYAHSSPYVHMVNNVSPESLHKLPNRQSSIQLNTSIETRQNIPQHIPINNQHKPNMNNNHHNLQAQNLQRHYLGLSPEFESPSKSLFHQHPNPPTIDLIESPIPMNAAHHQLSPDLYYNFNTAHHNNNQRRYQN